MAIKLLALHYQLVANLAPDDEDDDFVSLDIIQGAQFTRAKLELGQRIGPHAFDRLRGLMLKPGKNRRFYISLVARRQ
jgi:hypothetical protein